MCFLVNFPSLNLPQSFSYSNFVVVFYRFNCSGIPFSPSRAGVPMCCSALKRISPQLPKVSKQPRQPQPPNQIQCMRCHWRTRTRPFFLSSIYSDANDDSEGSPYTPFLFNISGVVSARSVHARLKSQAPNRKTSLEHRCLFFI